jgi:orotidine-5'-phosphate decarboxylase
MHQPKPIPPQERLILALDVPSPDEAKKLVQLLGDSVQFYKIGLELFMAGGYFELLDWLKAEGKKVFVDLKFFDVPETVASAVRQLRTKSADLCTIHGNDSIMRAAVREKGDLKLLAVTVLTSLDQGDIDDLGFKVDVASLVLSRAKRALEIGCDGVVSSGLEAKHLRENLDHKLVVVVPGIRPVVNKPSDDQKRTVDVEEAFALGAEYIVVGRPIRGAEDPKKAAQDVQARIKAYFEKRA